MECRTTKVTGETLEQYVNRLPKWSPALKEYWRLMAKLRRLQAEHERRLDG